MSKYHKNCHTLSLIFFPLFCFIWPKNIWPKKSRKKDYAIANKLRNKSYPSNVMMYQDQYEIGAILISFLSAVEIYIGKWCSKSCFQVQEHLKYLSVMDCTYICTSEHGTHLSTSLDAYM